MYISVFTLCFLFIFSNTKAQNRPYKPDVLQYHCTLEPDFRDHSIRGTVQIKCKVPITSDSIVFDTGDLIVASIAEKHINGLKQRGKQTIVWLDERKTEILELTILYSGKPKQGLVFPSDGSELYSLYFTNYWMPCHFSPADKATFALDLIVPRDLQVIASGKQESVTDFIPGGKLKHSWRQDYETPAYTFGFAVGDFERVDAIHQDRELHYYSNQYSEKELQEIFRFTGDMLDFFEEKAGIPLPQDSYSQVLMGNHYQEMSGFAMLKSSYGALILKDSTETHLLSHELAHQWWGNRITCRNWNHFWLNEGMATFMSAAYNEHRFGRKQYEKDIANYQAVYEKIKSKGRDKALVFADWSSPTRDDRNLVYFKGAYVLHLLRLELGEEVFWKGIREYSKLYDGKSVESTDFRYAMEEASGRSLTSFFEEWVY